MKLFHGHISLCRLLLICCKLLAQLASVCSEAFIVDEPFMEEELDCPGPNDRTLITAKEISVLWGDPWRAYKTVPEGLIVAKSRIPKAGYGLISQTFVKKFTWLGEYEGEYVSMDREDEISWYAWSIHRGGEDSHFVDALNIATSSSLRWVNCARSKAEQNVNVHECMGRVYYMTIKDVAPGQELFVYYGDGYAELLGIKKFE